MKKLVLISALGLATMNAYAQVNDSVITGAGYASQVWYSLSNDEQATAPKNEWDIAFDVKGLTSSIHINSVSGVTLWGYPKSDISGWSSVDTNGLSSWEKRYNSDTSWALGAMGRYADPTDFTDLDWGIYDMSTHIVNGDSLYIIRLTDSSYRKLAIEKLAGGTFTFKYADLDGSNSHTATIVKSSFTGKNFAYYSIVNDAALPAGREPDATDWDLLFTQYTTFLPAPYTVTGVLHNRGVAVAEAGGLADKNTYVNYGVHNFESAINTIGYDWKTYSGGSYVIKDSLAYFVKAVDGGIWKVIFTGFASGNGKSVFSKQQLVASGIGNLDNRFTASMALYPNPLKAADGEATVIYNFEKGFKNAELMICDLSGRIIHKDVLLNKAGLHQYRLHKQLIPGTYIISVNTDEGGIRQKLIVQ